MSGSTEFDPEKTPLSGFGDGGVVYRLGFHRAAASRARARSVHVLRSRSASGVGRHITDGRQPNKGQVGGKWPLLRP